MICPHCGKIHPDMARFCPVNGRPIPQSSPSTPATSFPSVCPFCNAENPSEASFCLRCGRRLKGESAQGAGAQVVIRVPSTLAAVDLWLTAIAVYVAGQAVFSILVAGALWLMSGAITGVGGVIEEISKSEVETASVAAAFLAFVAWFFTVLAVLEATAGVGLFRRKAWAGTLTVVLQIVTVPVSFVGLMIKVSGATLVVFVGTAVWAGLIWYYLRRSEVKEALK